MFEFRIDQSWTARRTGGAQSFGVGAHTRAVPQFFAGTENELQVLPRHIAPLSVETFNSSPQELAYGVILIIEVIRLTHDRV